MPELPEVETVRRSLERLIVGCLIAEVTVREPRLRKPLAPHFAAASWSNGAIIGRRGKYLNIGLDNGQISLVHLGMTGQLIVSDPQEPLRKHDHIIVTLGDKRSLRYNDTRRFGLMAIDGEAETEALMGLGVEPLTASFSTRYLWDKVQHQRTVKDVIMDQRVVAVGNIYASELLFRAKVQPGRPTGTLAKPRLHRLCATEAAEEAIVHAAVPSPIILTEKDSREVFSNDSACMTRKGSRVDPVTPILRETHGGRSSFSARRVKHEGDNDEQS